MDEEIFLNTNELVASPSQGVKKCGSRFLGQNSVFEALTTYSVYKTLATC